MSEANELGQILTGIIRTYIIIARVISRNKSLPKIFTISTRVYRLHTTKNGLLHQYVLLSRGSKNRFLCKGLRFCCARLVLEKSQKIEHFPFFNIFSVFNFMYPHRWQMQSIFVSVKETKLASFFLTCHCCLGGYVVLVSRKFSEIFIF